MRVVLTTGIFPPDIGGPATHSADLQAELTRRGHTTTVLSLQDDGSRPHKGKGLVRYPRNWPWPLRITAISWWLLRHRRSYEVVYATGLHEAAVLGGRLAKRPVVVKIVGDTVWERAKRLGLTTLSFDEFYPSRSGGLRVRAMRGFRNWVLTRATAITAPSEYLAAVVESWLAGPADVRVIRNGVKIVSSSESAPRRAGERLRAVYAGRLVSHKRIDVLIEGIAAVPGVVLDVIGDGPERQALEDCAQKLAVDDRIRFLGAVEHTQVMHLLAVADVLVLASAYEGLPHVAIEAMASGTPVIAPDVGGVREVVEDEVNGLIVHHPDGDGVAKAFRRLRDDAALLYSLSDRARRDADKWRFEKCADEIESLIIRSTTRKSRAVFFGKGGFPTPTGEDYRKKLEILSRSFAPSILTVGRGGIRRIGRVRVVAFPNLHPPLLGGLVFYVLGAPLAIVLAAGEKRGVVCQSPYEGFFLILCSRLLPKAYRPRIMVEIHGDWRTATRLYGSRSRRYMSPLADRAAVWAIRHADRVRVISDFTERLVREIGCQDQLERFITFSDFDMFLQTPTTPMPEGSRVAFVGSVEYSKGWDVLLKAWALVAKKVPGGFLTVAGDGTMLEQMRREAETLGLSPTIEFAGKVSRPDVKTLLDRSSLLVLPSRSEGLGRVILEAYARGRPVVATRVGGIPEEVEHERTGLLVPSEDSEALGAAIVKLLESPKRLNDMGKEARRRVVERDPLREFEAGIERLAVWSAKS